MMTAAVISATSMALRNSSQRQVTVPFLRSRWCSKPLTATSGTLRSRYDLSSAYQKPRSIGEFDHSDEPDEPARPD